MGLWHDEVFDDRVRFGLKIERTLFAEESDYQKIVIVQTEMFGKALIIDDVWMTSEGDEAYYHELIVHPALTTAPRIRRVLVIGGGDGGTVREVLRHDEVDEVIMVELDEVVVEACRTHLPEIGSAWDDPRLKVIIGDGAAYAADADAASFDVIIVDSPDPVGPAAALFRPPFYRNCRRLLAEDGVFVAQTESPITFRDVHFQTVRTIRRTFGTAHPYYYPVMLYASGLWSWTYASPGGSSSPGDIITSRIEPIEAQAEIYNRDVHRAAFAQPNFVKRELER